MKVVSRVKVHDCNFWDFQGKCCGRNSRDSVIIYKLFMVYSVELFL